MNIYNKDFFTCYQQAKEAYDLFMTYIDNHIRQYPDKKRPADIGDWLYNWLACTALQPQFRPNTLLRDKHNGDYAFCLGPSWSNYTDDHDSLDRICIVKADNPTKYSVSPHDYEKADIPQEFIDLVKKQLTANCPLKVPTCS